MNIEQQWSYYYCRRCHSGICRSLRDLFWFASFRTLRFTLQAVVRLAPKPKELLQDLLWRLNRLVLPNQLVPAEESMLAHDWFAPYQLSMPDGPDHPTPWMRAMSNTRHRSWKRMGRGGCRRGWWVVKLSSGIWARASRWDFGRSPPGLAAVHNVEGFARTPNSVVDVDSREASTATATESSPRPGRRGPGERSRFFFLIIRPSI